MAGAYPDVPHRRMALDVDGSILFKVAPTVGTVSIVTGDSTARAKMNDETHEIALDACNIGITTHGTSYRYGWIFPELRDIYGSFTSYVTGLSLTKLEHSADTTNGFSGTWTTQIANLDDIKTTSPAYRDDIESFSAGSKRAIRAEIAYDGGAFCNNNGMASFHVYGEIDAGETPDRLLWINNDDDLEFDEPIDYGDIPRGSAEDREVYLTNNSGSLTASSVSISRESLTGDSEDWYTMKEAGGSFGTVLNLASSIASGADSPVITVRRNTPDAQALGLNAARLLVDASWA